MAGGFEVISTSQSRELLDRLGNNQRKAAEATHAVYYVTGDLLRLGQGLRLNLRVEQTSSGHIQFAEKFDGDSPQDLPSQQRGDCLPTDAQPEPHRLEFFDALSV